MGSTSPVSLPFTLSSQRAPGAQGRARFCLCPDTPTTQMGRRPKPLSLCIMLFTTFRVMRCPRTSLPGRACLCELSCSGKEASPHLDLVTPASKVAEGLDGHAHVGLQGQGVDSACIQSLNGGQLFLVLLHEVCQPGRGREEGRKMAQAWHPRPAFSGLFVKKSGALPCTLRCADLSFLICEEEQ